MSWAFSEEGEEVVEVVAHATIDTITAPRRNAERKCFRNFLKLLIFIVRLLIIICPRVSFMLGAGWALAASDGQEDIT
jgi:hypothetical protein